MLGDTSRVNGVSGGGGGGGEEEEEEEDSSSSPKQIMQSANALKLALSFLTCLVMSMY